MAVNTLVLHDALDVETVQMMVRPTGESSTWVLGRICDSWSQKPCRSRQGPLIIKLG